MTHRLPVGWRARVLAIVACVPPLLHVQSLHRIASRVPVGQPHGDVPSTEALVREVDRWLNHLPWPWRRTCLKRAGVLYALLRRAGVEVELHIGVKRDDAGALAAHAWLMRNGAPFLEDPESPIGRFQVITRIPEPADGL